MTHLRTPFAAPRLPLAVTIAGLTLSASPFAFAQTPVDANPAPPPPAATAPVAPTQGAPALTPTASPAPPSITIAPASPAVVAPVPATGSASSQVSSPLNELNIAARDTRALNPVLNPTDTDLRDNLQAGRDLGNSKQDFIDLLNPATRPFDYRSGGMVGELRRAKSIAVWITPDIEARWRGLIEQRGFADQAQRDADFVTMQQEVTSPARKLAFVVEIGGLISSHTDPTQQQLDALYASLSGTRFVLSDDHGNNFNPLATAASGRLLRRQDFYDSLSSGPDRLGDTVFSTPPSVDSRNLVLRRKAYSDYAAFFVVTFDAFNPDGSARINRDVHTVTLRIVTPEEPKYAVYDVDKMP